MFRCLAVLLSLSILASGTGVAAAEPLIIDGAPGVEAPTERLTLPAEGSQTVLGDLAGGFLSTVSFGNTPAAVRLALCGVEADAGNAGLDAGLIDFNVPAPTHAVGPSSGDSESRGRTVPDYHSSVFLGITLGYHF